VDLDKYTELTGIEVSEADENSIEAQIRRTRSMLETMLGFTLDPAKTNTNIYNELGKSQSDCFCPNVNTSNLLDPDEVEGSYRLFRYDKNDAYFATDPFTSLYKVKLVYVAPGPDQEQGITIKTFDDDEIRTQVGRDGIAKYIQHCQTCLCSCECTDCVQLAVDADWLFEDCLPEDLLYVWADMVTYQADCKKDIKSESVTGHSYTKFDKVSPETEPQNLAIIKRYAGPYGTVSVMPV
jgi:hypothetical protein